MTKQTTSTRASDKREPQRPDGSLRHANKQPSLQGKPESKGRQSISRDGHHQIKPKNEAEEQSDFQIRGFVRRHRTLVSILSVLGPAVWAMVSQKPWVIYATAGVVILLVWCWIHALWKVGVTAKRGRVVLIFLGLCVSMAVFIIPHLYVQAELKSKSKFENEQRTQNAKVLEVLKNNEENAEKRAREERARFESIQGAMKSISLKPELATKYPNGYSIFGVMRSEIIPFKDEKGNPLNLDWTKSRAWFEKGFLWIRLPDLRLPDNSVHESNVVAIELGVTDPFRYWTFGSLGVYVQPVKWDADLVLLLVGIGPIQPSEKRDQEGDAALERETGTIPPGN